jgi:hypothetical protein
MRPIVIYHLNRLLLFITFGEKTPLLTKTCWLKEPRSNYKQRRNQPCSVDNGYSSLALAIAAPHWIRTVGDINKKMEMIRNYKTEVRINHDGEMILSPF